MSDEEPYWLGRASLEQQRLIKQHYVWTKTIGYLLHPSIASNLPENARIADIGTGTGIWLTDMAKASPPTHHFDGYDISDAQFLPADSLPSNVSLSLGDFKKPFPAALHGTYDVVNIRLIIISMGRGVWESTLRNVLTLLKPGGAIQWTEGNFLVARGFRGAAPASTGGHWLSRAQAQMNNTLVNRFGFNFPDFTQLYADAGLERVEEDVLSTDRLPEQRPDFTEIGSGAVLGALKNLAGAGGDGCWDEAKVEECREKARVDAESGAYLRWDIHVTVGFLAAPMSVT
ncbi:S-adenosyl-L-methionine-dependent methyltransferase [Massariosphaeria phaeospora]|uniref:S-adenosyl-L-methionine-dependent methyltransferase n=1 Tax=Massariosphaeria phaeospora TaxID=100035 RepID=A0A7C8MF91_9PLEO|nr:S-adenosyl-L-methionine-dependent methyltransferase [Massariosphaeria phaeospora]